MYLFFVHACICFSLNAAVLLCAFISQDEIHDNNDKMLRMKNNGNKENEKKDLENSEKNRSENGLN